VLTTRVANHSDLPDVTAASRIYCAIDRPDLVGAESIARALTGAVGGLKLGLEFFCANGPAGVARLRALGLPIFLDLKLHDIPNTVAGAIRAVAGLGVDLVTLHAAGGPAMLEAAVAARDAAGSSMRLLGVTVLTSLEDKDLVGVPDGVAAQVERLAAVCTAARLDGIVCSPLEVAMLRARVPASCLLVVPGIRPTGGADDQKRTMGPAAALAAGADLLVVGRPITTAPDPRAAALAMAA
jgi:orotidine-5'-phosphate decarboxylase